MNCMIQKLHYIYVGGAQQWDSMEWKVGQRNGTNTSYVGTHKPFGSPFKVKLQSFYLNNID